MSGQPLYGYSRGNDNIVNLGLRIANPMLGISQSSSNITDNEVEPIIPSEYDINPSNLSVSATSSNITDNEVDQLIPSEVLDLEQDDVNQGSNFTLDFQRNVKRYHNPTLHSQACRKGLSFVMSYNP
jgi:hypothetical protein